MSTVLSTRRFLPLIYIWQYLRTSLVVTPWGGNATGIYGQRPGVLQNVVTQGHPQAKDELRCAFSSRLTLCSHMDCSPPGSSVYGIFPARILECGAISYSRGSSHTSCISCPGRCILYHSATWEAHTKNDQDQMSMSGQDRIEKLAVETNPALTMGPETGVRVALICVCVAGLDVSVWGKLVEYGQASYTVARFKVRNCWGQLGK